jgi:hypothetical protein
VNEFGYFLLGAALGAAFHVWVLVYSVSGLRVVLDRFTDHRWEVDTFDSSVCQVNDRLWGAGMRTAEEERAAKRDCWTFELPPEQQTDRKESLRENENRDRQRFLSISQKLDEVRAPANSLDPAAASEKR